METSNITFVRGRLQRRKDGTIKYVSASYQKHLNGTEIHPNMTTILHTRSDSKFVETEKSLKYEKERIDPGKFRFDFFLRSEPSIRTSGRNKHTNDFFLKFFLWSKFFFRFSIEYLSQITCFIWPFPYQLTVKPQLYCINNSDSFFQCDRTKKVSCSSHIYFYCSDLISQWAHDN